ncbi:MAG: FAD-binding oxidoreductase, partial [Thermoleophilia bacterium]|nr:FAD-binding oxidoreductase [Thermoleophilia bacterium]
VRAIATGASGTRVHASYGAGASAGSRASYAGASAVGAHVELVNGPTVDADTVVVCTEAYLPGLLPELRGLVTPYRSQVLAARVGDGTTRVLSHPTWSRRGWDYAQQTARGVVIAGGELVEDQQLYRTWVEDIDDTDQAMLEDWVNRVVSFGPGAGDDGTLKVEVLQRWAGVLSHSYDDMPIIGRLPRRESIVCCGGWGGAGNVLGFVGGGMVAELLGGTDTIPPEFSSARIRNSPSG